MVSNIRYPHVINRWLRGRRPIARLMVGVVVVLLLFVAHRYVLGVGCLAYALYGPVMLAYLRVRRRSTVSLISTDVTSSSRGATHPRVFSSIDAKRPGALLRGYCANGRVIHAVHLPPLSQADNPQSHEFRNRHHAFCPFADRISSRRRRCAPRSFPGCWPVITAGDICCASKTPTWPAARRRRSIRLLEDLQWLGLERDNAELMYQSKRLPVYNAITRRSDVARSGVQGVRDDRRARCAA